MSWTILRGSSVFFGLAGLSSLAGCASVAPDAGFAAVQKNVSEQSGMRVEWNRTDEAEREADR